MLFFFLIGKSCQISTYLILRQNTFSLRFNPSTSADNRLRLNFRLNTAQPVILTISELFLSLFLSFFLSLFQPVLNQSSSSVVSFCFLLLFISNDQSNSRCIKNRNRFKSLWKPDNTSRGVSVSRQQQGHSDRVDESDSCSVVLACCVISSDSPIRVAREQWGTVGENLIMMRYSSSPSSWTSTHFSVTTSSSSRVLGFSGSRIDRITSGTGQETRCVSVYQN